MEIIFFIFTGLVFLIAGVLLTLRRLRRIERLPRVLPITSVAVVLVIISLIVVLPICWIAKDYLEYFFAINLRPPTCYEGRWFCVIADIILKYMWLFWLPAAMVVASIGIWLSVYLLPNWFSRAKEG